MDPTVLGNTLLTGTIPKKCGTAWRTLRQRWDLKLLRLTGTFERESMPPFL